MGSLIRCFTWYLSDMNLRLSSRKYSTNSPTYSIGVSLYKFFLQFSFDNQLNQLSVNLCRCYDDCPTQVKVRFSLSLTIDSEDEHTSLNEFSFPKGGSKGFTTNMTKEYLLECLENQCIKGTLIVICQIIVFESSFMHGGNIGGLSADLLKLRNESDSANAYLITKGERIPVHKEILSARSPVFKQMSGNSNCWFDTCFPTEVVKMMLDFLYSGEISNSDLDHYPPELLYACAEYYDISDLKKLLTPRWTYFTSVLDIKYEVHTVQFANFTKLCTLLNTMEHAPIKMTFADYIEMSVKMNFEDYPERRNIIIETTLWNLIGVKSLVARLFILDISNSKRIADEIAAEPDSEGRIKFNLKYASEKLFSVRNLIFPEDCLALRYELKFRLRDEFHISDPEVLEESIGGPMSNEVSSSLIRNMEYLLQSKHFADALLVLPSAKKTGVPKPIHVSVHKSILSARSPVFKDIFRTSQSTFVNLPASVANNMLHFIYTGHLLSSPPKVIDLLHKAAETYNINTLKRKCEQVITNTQLSNRNVFSIYSFAIRVELYELQKSCKDFIVDNKDIIIGNPKWDIFRNNYEKACEEIKQHMGIKS